MTAGMPRHTPMPIVPYPAFTAQYPFVKETGPGDIMPDTSRKDLSGPSHKKGCCTMQIPCNIRIRSANTRTIYCRRLLFCNSLLSFIFFSGITGIYHTRLSVRYVLSFTFYQSRNSTSPLSIW